MLHPPCIEAIVFICFFSYHIAGYFRGVLIWLTQVSRHFPPTKFSTHTLSTCAKIRNGDVFLWLFSVVEMLITQFLLRKREQTEENFRGM